MPGTAAPPPLTRGQLNRATLARQSLLVRSPTGVVDAVGALAGLQAQEPKPPFIGLWSRLAGVRPADLTAALGDRAVVRSTWLRATLHLTTAADYLASRPALQPVLSRAMKVLGARAEGLDMDRLLPVAREILADGPLTFSQMRPLLRARFPDVDERALGYAVRTNLPLVLVPSDDRWGFPSDSTFTLADEWLGAPVSGSASPERLVRAYLAAFGPATAADVQTWSGLQGIKGVLAAMEPDLMVFTDDKKRRLYDLPDAPRPDAGTPAPLRLLPDFDNLVLAYADRSRILADEHRPKIVTKNLRVRATVLWDGEVCATWELKATRTATTMTVAPFAPLPKAARAELEGEGAALVAWLDEGASPFTLRVDT